MEEEELMRHIAVFATSVVVYGVVSSVAVEKISRAVLKKDAAKEDLMLDKVPIVRGEKIQCVIPRTRLKKKVNKVINEFISVMKQNDFDLSCLYENFKTDCIVTTKGRSIGSYDIASKSLIVDGDDLRNTLLRALLDAATTKEYADWLYRDLTVRGFERWSYEVIRSEGHRKESAHTGYGLNAGYKDVLLNRLFGVPYRHEELADVCNLLEMVVGKRNMMSLFGKGDCTGVVEEVKTHAQAVGNPASNGMEYRSLLMMDSLYAGMYEQGLVGVELATKNYSSIVTWLAELVVRDANRRYKEAFEFEKDCWHPGNDVFWESGLSVYEDYVRANTPRDEVREIVDMLKKTREILAKYRNRGFMEPRLTKRDCEKLREVDKKYSIRPMSIIG